MVLSRSLSQMGLDFVYLPMINKDRPITGLKFYNDRPSYTRAGIRSRMSRSLDFGECDYKFIALDKDFSFVGKY